MSAGYVKRKDGDGFKVETMKYPTLVSMGLLVDPLNEVDSSTTADTFTSSPEIPPPEAFCNRIIVSRFAIKTGLNTSVGIYVTPNDAGVK